MILLDANVLLYAYDPRSEHHEACREWLEQALSGEEPVCLPWPTVLAFLRITTNRRIYEQPLRIDEALAVVDSWLERPCVSVLEASEACWEILRELLVSAQASGPLVMDAFLAALARENGATLVTSDRDFARFEGLKRLDPTATSGA